MLAIKVMGLMDALVAFSILLYEYDIIHWNFMLAGILYLVAKCLMFRNDIASLFDGIVVIIIIFMMFEIQNSIILILAMFYLLQKALRSMT